MTTDDIKDIIFDWLTLVFPEGVTVIFAGRPSGNQAGAPTPQRPFCRVGIGPPIHIGDDIQRMREVGHEDGDEIVDCVGTRERTLSFMVFADNTQAADDLCELIRRGALAEGLKISLGDLIPVRILGVVNRISERGGVWEGRSNLDILFRYTARYTDEPGIIDTTSFEGTIEGHVTHEFNVDVDLTEE